MSSLLESRQSLSARDPEIIEYDTRGSRSEIEVRSPRIRTALSLFSGGGGLDLGVERAGFRTLACIEKDPNCCETLANNQPKFFADATVINGSVDDVDLTALMQSKGLGEGDLDLLFGGPPCQTFSQIGKQGGINDARGRLLFSMVDYARVLRPKAILIENVKALLSAKDLSEERGGVVRQLEANLHQLGYKCVHKVINSADFGVAQKRQRLFIVGLLGEAEFQFPTSLVEPAEYRTVSAAIAGLPAPAEKGSASTVPNHIDVTPAGDRKRISYVPEGMFLAKVADAPPDIKGRLSPKDTTKFLRLGRDKLSNTLRCGEIFFHPTEDRYLTPREYMRLHGFPDDYHLSGPIRGRSGSVRNLDQHRQIANSVPPPVAEAIARAIVLQMESVPDARSSC
jgi:DNA (cytosine-5)-methyltransferase 1